MRTEGRRSFLKTAGVAAVGAVTGVASAQGEADMGGKPMEVAMAKTVAEGIMHEHSIIQRLMGVYEECAARLDAGDEPPSGVIVNAGAVADEFVENYHEAYEENHLYVPFQKQGVATDAIAVMHRQHQVGRALIGQMIFLAGEEELQADDRRKLANLCRAYPRMYRAHAAHEDTVLLPHDEVIGRSIGHGSLHGVMMAYRRQKLGGLDLEGVMDRVAELEEGLGIADLDHFTAEA
ncbi:MAG: hemerythrin domain-containing protein [Planctomycetota bacterium]